MTYRYKIEILASGQPRPYADSRSHVRLTIDTFRAWLGDPNDERSEWVPNDSWKEEEVRALLPYLRCGFPTKEPENWADAQLAWLKKTAPGVWEFYTISAYTG